MRIFTLSLVVLFSFTSCATKNQEKETDNQSQEIVMQNKELDDNGNKMLVGHIDENNFKTSEYDWYDTYYDSYELDTTTINTFKEGLKDYDIKIFMGTWCSDSQRETPHFYKVIEYADFPDSQIEMYGVDRNKQSLNQEEEGLEITHVPTFIFYKNGQEAGRIIESPINTLEEDIKDIVEGNPQTPNY